MRTSTLLLVATSLLVVTTARADSFDSKLTQQCPATAAWTKAHPSSNKNFEAIAARDAKRHFSEPAVRKELAKRYAKDQEVRAAWVAANYSKTSSRSVMSVDASNLAWLKPMVLQHGFLTVDQVGEEGISNAWLLVQHATTDPGFQARVLREIAPLLKTGEISQEDYALLEDRVRVEQGKLQIYGTQFYVPNGKDGKPRENKDGTLDMQMRPVADPQHVDQRRAAMGLMPLADYKCILRIMYASSNQIGHGTSEKSK